METNPTFGLSGNNNPAGLDISSGAMTLVGTTDKVGTWADGSYMLPYMAGSQTNITSLTGVNRLTAMTSMAYIQSNQIISGWQIYWTTLTGAFTGLEICMLTCPRSNYEGNTVMDFSETVMDSLVIGGAPGAFKYDSGEYTGAQPNVDDFVMFGIKNNRGAATNSFDSIVSIDFNWETT